MHLKKIPLLFMSLASLLSLPLHAFNPPDEAQMQMVVFSSLDRACEEAAGSFWGWTERSPRLFAHYQKHRLIPSLRRGPGGLAGVVGHTRSTGSTLLTDLLMHSRNGQSLRPTIEAIYEEDRQLLNFFALNNGGLNTVFLAALNAGDAPVIEFLLTHDIQLFKDSMRGPSMLLPAAVDILQRRLARITLSREALKGLGEKGMSSIDVKMLGQVLDRYEEAKSTDKEKTYRYLLDLISEMRVGGDTQEANAFLLRLISHVKAFYTLGAVLQMLNDQPSKAAFVSELSDGQHFDLTEAVIKRLEFDRHYNPTNESAYLVRNMLIMLNGARVNIGAEKDGKSVLLHLYLQNKSHLNALTRVALWFIDVFSASTLQSLR